MEESAIIIDVGEWVIDEACRQLRAWRECGIAPPRIALNVGARHFQQEGISVIKEIHATGCEAVYCADVTAQCFLNFFPELFWLRGHHPVAFF